MPSTDLAPVSHGTSRLRDTDTERIAQRVSRTHEKCSHKINSGIVCGIKIQIKKGKIENVPGHSCRRLFFLASFLSQGELIEKRIGAS